MFKMRYGDTLVCLQGTDSCFDKAQHNMEAKFRLLMNAVTEQMDMIQFVLFRTVAD